MKETVHQLTLSGGGGSTAPTANGGARRQSDRPWDHRNHQYADDRHDETVLDTRSEWQFRHRKFGATYDRGHPRGKAAARTVAKTGARTLILGASNTFTGGLAINAGTVKLTNAGALNAHKSLMPFRSERVRLEASIEWQ